MVKLTELGWGTVGFGVLGLILVVVSEYTYILGVVFGAIALACGIIALLREEADYIGGGAGVVLAIIVFAASAIINVA
jgi:hypothetical protein